MSARVLARITEQEPWGAPVFSGGSMNRRRILSSVHREIARGPAPAVAPVDHSTIERMSIRDLDRIGPRLVTTPPVEQAICIFCTSAPASDANFPYCSPECGINAGNG